MRLRAERVLAVVSWVVLVGCSAPAPPAPAVVMIVIGERLEATVTTPEPGKPIVVPPPAAPLAVIEGAPEALPTSVVVTVLPGVEAPVVEVAGAAEIPKAEAPKVETKTQRPKVEAPKVAPKADAPKADAPKVAAKVDAPKADAPKVEAPKVEAPKVEAPKTDAPKVEAPAEPAAADGGALFRKYGCSSCHAVRAKGIGMTGDGGDSAPDLSSIGRSIDKRAIASFLLQKLELKGNLHMRKFRGSTDDLKALATWLEALK